jgi:SpoVK/Ycf46/Vps4 family AAA+-type ATPase
MEIRLTQDVLVAVGAKNLKPYGVEIDHTRWERGRDINLAQFSRAKVLDLRNLIEPFTKEGGASTPTKGAALAVRDITIWLGALKDVAGAKPRTVQNFYSMVKRYLLKEIPGQRVYRWDKAKNCWWAFYVGEVKYHRRYEDRGHTYPARCEVSLFNWEFGKLETETVNYYEDDIRNVSVARGLAAHELIGETAELRALYMTTLDRYNANVMEVGKQFWARGSGSDDLDGNQKNEDRWYSSRTNVITLDKNGEPSRVVVDVFRENDKEERSGEEHMNERFWYYEARKRWTTGGDEEDEEETEAADEAEEDFVKPEVPVHPTMAIFDLRRHTRLRVHIEQLTEYVYDVDLGAKLVLPDDDRALVEILLADHSAFADIVAGKGGGAVVMCTGRPGLGKTLTAEVYAEVTRRPLFSVQCSQLGTSPDDLEDELLKSFARAERWNAILLLDEADVYVAPRGMDLVQNAIVGVFLRTLEYYKGVMFMTTNRVDLVDDAIASRCIARLQYDVPTLGNQMRLWRILADTAKVPLADVEISRIVKDFPALSGRDIKNLLKLGSLVGQARGTTAVTAKLITFVKRFKPTVDLVEEEAE